MTDEASKKVQARRTRLSPFGSASGESASEKGSPPATLAEMVAANNRRPVPDERFTHRHTESLKEGSQPNKIVAGLEDAVNGRIARETVVHVGSPPEPPASKVGWKLVPIEPTQEMIDVWWTENEGETSVAVRLEQTADDEVVKDAWAAMLAAAPSPTPEEGGYSDEVVEAMARVYDEQSNPTRSGTISAMRAALSVLQGGK